MSSESTSSPQQNESVRADSEDKESRNTATNGTTSKKSQNGSANKQTRKVRYSFQKRPFVIGVAGGTASGKSTVCSKIMEKLGPIDPTSVYLSHEKRVICISQDSFYRKMTDADRTMVTKGNFNFDHPAAFDVVRLVQTLRDVLNGKMVKVPIYNYIENEISDQEETIYPADVILVEGLLLFYFPEVRDMFHMKIFVDTDPDTRLARRVMRDVKERNRDLNTCLTLYTKFVKPSFEEFCLPTKKYADIIVPRGPDNEVAVDLIVTHTRSIIDPSIRHRSIDYGQYGLMNGDASAAAAAAAALTATSVEDLNPLHNHGSYLVNGQLVGSKSKPQGLVVEMDQQNHRRPMSIESEDESDEEDYGAGLLDSPDSEDEDAEFIKNLGPKLGNGQSIRWSANHLLNQSSEDLSKLSIRTSQPIPEEITTTNSSKALSTAAAVATNGYHHKQRKNGVIHNNYDDDKPMMAEEQVDCCGAGVERPKLVLMVNGAAAGITGTGVASFNQSQSLQYGGAGAGGGGGGVQCKPLKLGSPGSLTNGLGPNSRDSAIIRDSPSNNQTTGNNSPSSSKSAQVPQPPKVPVLVASR